MIFVEKTERTDPAHRYRVKSWFPTLLFHTNRVAPLDNRRMFYAHIDANPKA